MVVKSTDVSRMGLAVLVSGVVGCGEGDGPTVVEPDPCVSASVSYPDDPTQVGSTEHVHDPEIARDGAAYFIYSTNDGIPIRRSTDLLNWSFMGRVFPNQLPAWAPGEVPGVEAPWAPGIGFFNGRYHLYYSLSTFGSPRSVIGLTTNRTLDPQSAEYEWQDRGKVVESFAGDDYNAIDAAVVEDADGGLWLTWGSWGGGIKMRALDRQTGFFSAADSTLYSLARRPMAQALEAPFIIRRDSYYYLFVSFDLCCRGVESTYTVRVGRSAAVTGPYVDRDGFDMRQGGGSVVVRGYGRVRGPGHASVLSEGGEHLLVHHYYDAEDGGVPHLQIRPLLWDDEGWPLAGGPFDGTWPTSPSPDLELAGSWGYWAEGSAPRQVELQPGGQALACDGAGTWSYTAPMLTVEWDSIDGRGARIDHSVVAGDGASLVGRTGAGGLVRGYLRPVSN